MFTTPTTLKALAFATIISQAAGHGYVQDITCGGVSKKGYFNDASADGDWPTSDSPAWKVINHSNEPSSQTSDSKVNFNSLDAICGNGASDPPNGAGAQPPPPDHSPLTVPSGQSTQCTLKWGSGGEGENKVWPHNMGFVADYMANCGGDCHNAKLDSLQWFKIDQFRTNGAGDWAMLKLQQDHSWTTTIPSGLADGQYILKQDLVNLDLQQPANNPFSGAQLYPACFTIQIGQGGGGSTPSGAELRVGTQIYNSGEQAFTVNAYDYKTPTRPSGPQDLSSYPMPGMQVIPGGQNSKREPEAPGRLAERDMSSYWVRKP